MSEIRKNLGGVTAYAYARSKGYTGTEDEFAQLMANYASVGQAAEEAAEQAIAAEINAESAAQTATTKASEASTSATSAAASASAAGTSETNAASSATSASGSATTAATSASAAQAAQAAAEAVLESIPEDYSELSNDVESLKSEVDNVIIISDTEPTSDENKIWINSDAESVQVPTMDDLYKAFIEETTQASSMATFTDGADGIPVKQITVFGVPIQDGSGDPSPTNIRNLSGRTSCTINHSGADETDYDSEMIAFPESAGTIYAFTLNIFGDGTGELIKTHVYIEMPLDSWNMAGTKFWHNISQMKNSSGGNIGWCSHYKTAMRASAQTNNSIVFGDSGYSSAPRIVVMDSRYSTANAFMEYLSAQKLANTPVTIAYPLATSVRYDLSAEQIATLLGENRLWTESGDIQVTYRADTKLYINKLTL